MSSDCKTFKRRPAARITAAGFYIIFTLFQRNLLYPKTNPYSELYRKIQDTQMLKDNSEKIKYITENLTKRYLIWQNIKNKIFF